MSSILSFLALLESTQSFEVRSTAGTLGDGAEVLGLPIGRIVEDSWQLTSIPLLTPDKDALVATLQANTAKGLLWQLRQKNGEWELQQDNLGQYEWDSWSTTPIGAEYWQVELTLKRTGHQEIDECLLRPTDLATTYPLFPLGLYLNGANQSYETITAVQRFRGGIEERRSYGYNAVRDRWSFTATVGEHKRNELIQFLSDRCGNFFEFKIAPDRSGRIYTCLKWSARQIGVAHWEMSFEFSRCFLPFRQSDVKSIIDDFDFYGSQEEIIEVMQATFADIDEKLDGAYDWLLRYKRNEYPLILNEQWLLVNSFHTVLGRGGYFPPSAGPTEAQAVIARASMYAYYATGKTKWLELAKSTGDALLNYFYPVKIPANWKPADGIRVPHWLINIKAPFVSKGALSTTGDPLNMGHFDLVLNFVNGVAQIPYGTPHFGELVANVYRVYPAGDRLLWKNVYAKPIGGFEYGIDYWVTNVMLDGIISRQYGDSESPSGRRPTPTNEPIGKIVLSTPFTGQAKVVYSSYSGPVIGVNELFEPYPAWRSLRKSEALAAIDVFPWSEDAYDFLWQATQESKWYDARECTRYSEIIAATVINPTAWYKRDDSPNPFAYPGSQVILANHPEGATFTASRVLSGDKKDWLQCDIPASPELYPSAELQNFAVQAVITPETSVLVEYAHSQVTEIEVILSLAKNPFDFSQYYTARLPVPGGGVPVTRSFSPREFLLWDVTQTSWHPYIADDPVYTYKGQGGAATVARVEETIDGIKRAVWRIVLDKNSGFAGAGFVCLGVKPRIPLTIFYKHVGDDARILVTTTGGKKYSKAIKAAEWGKVTFPADVLKNTDDKSPSDSFATNVEIEANDESTTFVWWIGAAPKELPAPVKTYKALLTSRVKTAHTFWVGQFEGVGSPSSVVKGNPGVVPFTANVENDGEGGQYITSWRGAPYSGYMFPSYFVKTAQWSRLKQVLEFLKEAQDAYADQNANHTRGPFMPVYLWNYWDTPEYSPTGQIDVWSYSGADPNTEWEGYFCRPLESTAHAWQKLVDREYPGGDPPNRNELIELCKKIVMDYLNWQSSFYVKRKSLRPPSNFPQSVDPYVAYPTTHYAAFMLRGAIYANIAGGNSAVTMRLIKASYDFLDMQYIRSSAMQGAFFAEQPTFTANGIVFNEAFGFHQSEAIEALAILKQKAHLLNYPRCVYFIRKP